jgi:phospholipase/carboxylesterase
MPGIADHLLRGVSPEAAKVLCIFVHGRSQTPEEMEAMVIRRLSALPVSFVLPRAREGAWYTARAIDALTGVTRAELDQSLTDLAELVAAMREGAGTRPILLAGFSQGACLVLELVFSGRALPGAVAALTGCRVGTIRCERPATRLPDMPVYLTGAHGDPWIPVEAFAEAAEALGRSGAALRADLFPDRPHAVSDAEIAMLDGMLMDLASGQRPRMEAAR